MSNVCVDFYGSFLSKHRGSIGPSEMISKSLENSFEIKRVSDLNNRWARFFHSIYNSLTSCSNIAVLDVYSTRVIWQTYLLSKILSLRNRKLIVVLHGGGLIDNYSRIQKAVDGILGRSKHVLTPSNYLADFYQKKGYKIQVLPNPIDTALFSNNKRLKPKEVVVLWVRAFDKIYDPYLAVETFSKFQAIIPESRLVMIGPDRGELSTTRQRVEELGISQKVEFKGPVQHTDLPKYFQSASVFLNTTKFESFGLALFEAAAALLPIVTTSVGEIKASWSHQEEALLHEARDASQLANSILRVIQNDALRSELIKNAYAKTQHCSPSMVLNEWMKILRDIDD